jgi:BirA family biotin operon repressor/biotin-[acetyl-CoA-carboxylase] ligase
VNPPAPASVLTTAALAAAFADAAPGTAADIEALDCVASSNDTLLARARAGQPARPQLLAVERQTAGRGRRQRAWHAPRAALLFSLAVPLSPLPSQLPAVTLAVGAALAEALAARGVAVQLKWPNDLLLGGRKLAGILCELALDAAGRATLVIGVGVNVAFDAAVDARSTSHRDAAALADVLPADALIAARPVWIATLAATALSAVHAYARDGFAPWRARCNARLAGRGTAVALLEGDARVAHGTLVDVDEHGRLVLATAEGERRYASGDLSLRAAASVSPA